jgi:hypothetical protein
MIDRMTLQILAEWSVTLERKWDVRPVITLACAGGTDEAWHLWHPHDYCAGLFPTVIVPTCTGWAEFHPDGRMPGG